MSRKISLLLILMTVLLTLAASLTQAQDADFEALVTGNTAFAFDLLHQVAGNHPNNLFYSPYSVSQALAMTYAGARGATEQDMAKVLHFTLGQAKLPVQFQLLAGELACTCAVKSQGSDGQTFQLNIANALWGDQAFTFKPDYLQTLNQYYGAGLKTTDFQNAPDAARQEINDWVAQQTKDKIQDIVPQGAITPDTRLVLANAIYFNASWMDPFDKNSTQDDTFVLLDSSPVTVPMMSQSAAMDYLRGDTYQAVELPYFGGSIAMLIVLPDEGQFEAFQKSLDGKTFDTIRRSLGTAEVNLSMPRFKYDYTVDLSDPLKAMGMASAFSDKADFSGMADAPLSISSVLHKAYIGVDESGTEAAAATAAIVGTTAMAPPQQEVDLRIDRPFIFTIYDQQTGTVLFVGQVMNPAAA